MNKAKRLKKGDKIAIVSLSSGMLGESFTKHNLEIATNRLQSFGLEVVYMDNALKGTEYVHNHPEKRADDLMQAFRDDSIKGIICAIGGDDTYRTLPYLMENEEFIQLVQSKPKIFTGFSDTTTNHLMFYQLGLTTYYGMALITDLGEISDNMLPYTEKYFRYYLHDTDIFEKITPSAIWYEERTDFSRQSIGIERTSHEDQKGYELLQGAAQFEGELLGGCVESLYDMLVPYRHADKPTIIAKYHIFPPRQQWKGKILFIETSEEQPTPESFRKMMEQFKQQQIFNVISGILVGKPQDEVHYEQYKKILIEVIDDPNLPIVFNVNFGHATPRCILPIGIKARVEVTKQEIRFLESPFSIDETTLL